MDLSFSAGNPEISRNLAPMQLRGSGSWCRHRPRCVAHRSFSHSSIINMATNNQQPSEPPSQTKPPPKKSSVPIPFTYLPSPDGIDQNLLIFLHKHEDTQAPSARIGRELNLPKTAILALRAPKQVPDIDHPGYQWYSEFTKPNLFFKLFDPMSNSEERVEANLTPSLKILMKLLVHLTTHCHWPPSDIHLFGREQGGSVAVEFGIHYWRSQCASDDSQPTEQIALGSIVTISGHLLSRPTPLYRCPTPLLVYHQHPEQFVSQGSGFQVSRHTMTEVRKVYETVEENMVDEDPLLRTEDDWKPIVKFWSKSFKRRAAATVV